MHHLPAHLLLLLAFWLAVGLWLGTELFLGSTRRGGGGKELDSGTKNRAILLFQAGILFSIAVSFLPWSLPQIHLIWIRWAGIVLVLLGVLVRIWAVHTLGQFFTVSIQIREGQTVVHTGPYRWVRHPSYTGIMLSTAGFGLGLQNLASLVIALTFGFIALYQRIRVEERVLLENLGKPYEEFCRGRKRLIPWIW